MKCKISLSEKRVHAEQSDMAFKASKTSIGSFTQLSVDYRMVHLVTKHNCTLSLWKWRRYGTELEEASSMLCVSLTSTLHGRHDILTERCSSALFRFCTAVLRSKASKPFDMESKYDSLVSTLVIYDFLWLLLMEVCYILCVPWAPAARKRLKTLDRTFNLLTKVHWTTSTKTWKVGYATLRIERGR